MHMLKFVVLVVVALVAALVTCVGAGLAERRGRTTVASLSIAAALLFSVVLLLKPNSLVLANITVLVSAVLVGSGLGLLLRTRPALVSFSVVASIADVLSTSGGVTNAVSVAYREGTINLMLLLSVSCPFEGRVQQVIGIDDLMVLAAIFFALRRLGYRGVLSRYWCQSRACSWRW